MKHDIIDTRIGTFNYPDYSNGNTLPYTGVPFGMNYFSVQNHQEGSWWFDPYKPLFQGFRCTHQPSPWMGDFSHFLITPYTFNPNTSSLRHLQSSYRPQEATFNPSFIELENKRFRITSKLTASTYGFSLQNKSLENSSIKYIISAQQGIHNVEIDSNYITFEIKNYSGSEDKDFTMFVALKNVSYLSELSQFNDGSTILKIDTQTSINDLILATSFISKQQAKLNLDREPSDFNTMRDNSRNLWEEKFNKFDIQDKNKDNILMFYSSLYRIYLFPQTFFEVNENNHPVHYDTYSKKVRKGFLYTNNGFWDTYKTLFPLFSILEPELYENMLEGFLNSYKETGYLPKWLSPDERGLMPGTLVDAVISDALTKGIGKHLDKDLYEAMKKSATVESANPQYGRRAVNDYWKYGYVPANYSESVNQSLDNSYSDFAIAQVAKLLNYKDDYNKFIESSKNYKHLFDSGENLMRAKDKEGNFISNFNSHDWGYAYTEGSAWQNSWAVYHDIQGLINLFDSNESFINKLTELVNQEPFFNSGSYGFEIHEMSEVSMIDFGQMAISNQPSFHIPYLFTYAKKPESTQILLRSIMRETFKPTFDGYPGDEDNGSMSAWYIFNAMGFYPVAPGTQEYVLGIPFFDSISIKLNNGNTISLKTKNNTNHHNFVYERTMNNKPYQKLYLNHHDLINGINLTTTLGIVPSNKVIKDEDLPYSLSK